MLADMAGIVVFKFERAYLENGVVVCGADC